eukprot:TRINITY_DN111903_c0_g1_i1.p1 TRINITY_DN111903_c0_g1~~TRINITY_DN111903_c0_g1_i1.p1  ORF type:complete len:364 (+),score=55.88 TRINITY_DN111903_c0_g1_i1:90-1181(+)
MSRYAEMSAEDLALYAHPHFAPNKMTLRMAPLDAPKFRSEPISRFFDGNCVHDLPMNRGRPAPPPGAKPRARPLSGHATSITLTIDSQGSDGVEMAMGKRHSGRFHTATRHQLEATVNDKCLNGRSDTVGSSSAASSRATQEGCQLPDPNVTRTLVGDDAFAPFLIEALMKPHGSQSDDEMDEEEKAQWKKDRQACLRSLLPPVKGQEAAKRPQPRRVPEHMRVVLAPAQATPYDTKESAQPVAPQPGASDKTPLQPTPPQAPRRSPQDPREHSGKYASQPVSSSAAEARRLRVSKYTTVHPACSGGARRVRSPQPADPFRPIEKLLNDPYCSYDEFPELDLEGSIDGSVCGSDCDSDCDHEA